MVGERVGKEEVKFRTSGVRVSSFIFIDQLTQDLSVAKLFQRPCRFTRGL